MTRLPAWQALDVSVEASGIATIVMDRPDKLNAVGEAMHTELSLIFRQMQQDQAVRVIVLTGRGRSFSAGGDLAWMQQMIDEPERFIATTRQAREIVMSMLECDKPVIAKVNGHAVGLGATLALLCDVIFAAEHAKFGDPHVSAGLVAADGGALIWPQLIGYARAKEYLLTGDLLTAAHAERIGLINHVVPADELDARVAAFAQRLAAGSQPAIRWTKATINIGLRQLAAAMLDAGLAYEALTNVSADHAEAVAAFAASRKPVFQ
jgi:enoyl-CoA hydratase